MVLLLLSLSDRNITCQNILYALLLLATSQTRTYSSKPAQMADITNLGITMISYRVCYFLLVRS
jgi:hypothetical protein